jgi:hypothetical protein
VAALERLALLDRRAELELAVASSPPAQAAAVRLRVSTSRATTRSPAASRHAGERAPTCGWGCSATFDAAGRRRRIARLVTVPAVVPASVAAAIAIAASRPTARRVPAAAWSRDG